MYCHSIIFQLLNTLFTDLTQIRDKTRGTLPTFKSMPLTSLPAGDPLWVSTAVLSEVGSFYVRYNGEVGSFYVRYNGEVGSFYVRYNGEVGSFYVRYNGEVGSFYVRYNGEAGSFYVRYNGGPRFQNSVKKHAEFWNRIKYDT
jgi:predicted heme/steroid binding protein